MTPLHSVRPAVAALAVLLSLVLVVSPRVVAQTPAAQATPSLVTVAALEVLLPVPDGWTKARSGGSRVDVSADCSYAFADALFLKDAMKVRLTVADTGRNQDSLMMMASLVVTFPDDYSGTVPKNTTITRMRFNEAPAGARWDADSNEGEFVVVIDGRFVVRAEGSAVESINTLKTMVGYVDFKKLVSLK